MEGSPRDRPLESEASVLTCMIYVDLNPIRSQMAMTPEESDFTGAIEQGTEPWGQAKFDRACFVPLSAELER